MTIYMVQHAFSRPEWEEEWNAWYSENLKVLLGVPGFRSGQRFKALGGSPPRYMAVYTVDSPAVFESRPYIEAGGGGTNSLRFRPAYQVWIRNLFEGLERAPEVRESERLVAIDAASPEREVPGVTLAWMHSTGFHKSTPYRAIAVIVEDQIEAVRRHANVDIYQPITPQQKQLY